MSEKSVSTRTLNNNTIPILIPLFAIKIVAKSFLGRSNNLTTMAPLVVFFSSILLTSVGERAKRATSAPEIKAEQSNKSSKMPIFRKKAPLKASKKGNKLRGSGSNSYNLDCSAFFKHFISLKIRTLCIRNKNIELRLLMIN